MSPGSEQVCYYQFRGLFFHSIQYRRLGPVGALPQTTLLILSGQKLYRQCHPVEIAWNVLWPRVRYRPHTVIRSPAERALAAMWVRKTERSQKRTLRVLLRSTVSGGETRPAAARAASPRPESTSERQRRVSRRTESATKKIPDRYVRKQWRQYTRTKREISARYEIARGRDDFHA